MLGNEWDSVQLAEWGLDVWENEDDVKEEPTDLSENLKETFEVIITCDNEQEQEETFNYLTEKNYICRVLTL
jgi:hypothetical protein